MVFLLQQLSHTDPVHAYLGANASQAAVAQERHVLGYDRPVIDQYFTYVGDAVHGNSPESLRTRRPVATDIRAYLPATAELALTAWFLAVVLGAILGLGSVARFEGSGTFRLVMLGGASMPAFLLALVAILFLNGKLHWLPATGDSSYTNAPTGPTGMVVVDTLLHGKLAMFGDAIRHLILPALCVSLGPGRFDRAGSAHLTGVDHRLGLRPHGAGQGSPRSGQCCSATPSATR